jgi:hypothetical protein
MDFKLPHELNELLRQIERVIDQEIRPLQAQDDNERFFDHRREWARTDFDQGGLPRPEWEALLLECAKPSPLSCAEAARWLRPNDHDPMHLWSPFPGGNGGARRLLVLDDRRAGANRRRVGRPAIDRPEEGT